MDFWFEIEITHRLFYHRRSLFLSKNWQNVRFTALSFVFSCFNILVKYLRSKAKIKIKFYKMRLLLTDLLKNI